MSNLKDVIRGGDYKKMESPLTKEQLEEILLNTHVDNEREFVCYTGDGKGNLLPIEQTERFHQMMLEYVQKMYPDKQIIEDKDEETNIG